MTIKHLPSETSASTGYASPRRDQRRHGGRVRRGVDRGRSAAACHRHLRWRKHYSPTASTVTTRTARSAHGRLSARYAPARCGTPDSVPTAPTRRTGCDARTRTSEKPWPACWPTSRTGATGRLPSTSACRTLRCGHPQSRDKGSAGSNARRICRQDRDQSRRPSKPEPVSAVPDAPAPAANGIDSTREPTETTSKVESDSTPKGDQQAGRIAELEQLAAELLADKHVDGGGVRG